jgi:signal transduction histidine kinase
MDIMTHPAPSDPAANAGTKIAPIPGGIGRRPIRRVFENMGFQAKLLLVFALVLGVVMGLFLFIHSQSEAVLLRNSVANLRDMVNIVHYSTQRLSTERHIDEKELDQFLHEVIRKSSVFEVSVVDFNNQVIASSDQKKVGIRSNVAQEGIEVREQTELPEAVDGKVHYEVRIPLVKDKEVIGIVQISILLNSLRDYFWKISQKQVLILVAAIIVSFMVFSFFLRRLHRPFTEMAVAAKKVSNGDFNIQLKAAGGGESAEMAAAFNQMARKLLEQRAMEERLFNLERRAILTELGASLAHEIRNPLNLMNLTLHHLGKTCRPVESRDQEVLQSSIDSLKSEIQHLNRIVTEFLDLGRPERPARKRFSLKNLVSDVGMRLHHKMDQKVLRLDLDCPDEVEMNADQEQFRLVFLNLFLNCIDAVPENSSIEFRARKAAEGGAVECTVADKGPGIEPEDLEQVFEPYYSKRDGGIGMGLTLVRRIIENHGGEIHATNRPWGGAEFKFTVPVEG